MKKNIQIGFETKICRDQNQLCSEIDEELVMLNIANSEYYALNSVGKEIWELTETTITYGFLIKSLMERYSVSDDECELDTKPFLEEMIHKRLIQIVK